MKAIFIVLLGVVSYVSCNIQNKTINSDEANKSLYLALQSREKADKVLGLFDTIASPKLLYSIEDKHYLVIIQNNQNFAEYYVKMNSNRKILDIRLLFSIESKSELLVRAFDLEKYSSELLIDNRNIISAKKYFVIKDINGNRYAECSVLSLPFVHIEETLNLYCAKRLAEIIYSFEMD